MALDLETTGLSPGLDRVIEIGAVRFRDGVVLDRFQTLVRPEVPIPEAVQELTGIRDQDVAGAPRPQDALKELLDFVGESPVVAHSGHFDLSFLEGDSLERPAYELFDTLELARILLPAAHSHSLPQLSRLLGLSHERPHRALSDADAARQLFSYLWGLARSLAPELLDRMLEITAGWEHPVRAFLHRAQTAGPHGHASLAEPEPPAATATAEGVPLDSPRAIADLLGPGGPMARLDDYEFREAQQQMALAVAQLYDRGGRLLVEAGPGTGKSLAYLVPAINHAVRNEERVVVATNTITLQEQIFLKDVPLARQLLPFDFKAALLKGRANYVSLRRWNRYLNAPSRRVDGSWFAEEVKFKLRMLIWLSQTREGDRSEIRLQGFEDAFWARAASTPDDCLAAHCDNYRSQRCFYWNSRRAAQDADLIVVNHALLLADALGSGTVLPEHHHLVIDEAHQLADTAVEALMVRVTEEDIQESLESMLVWFRAAAGPLSQASRNQAQELRAATNGFFRELRAIFRQRELSAEADGVRTSELPRQPPDNRLLLDQVALHAAELSAALAAAERLLSIHRGLHEQLELEAASMLLEANPHALRELDIFRDQLDARIGLIDEALLRPRSNRLYWLNVERRSGRPLVLAAPTESGRTLQERALRHKRTAVFTSASLSVGESFDFFKRGVGMTEDAYELVLPSPFDYLSQALICLPSDVRDLEDRAFLDQATAVVAGIGRALGGRTLVLFTAHQQLRELADRLLPRLAPAGVQVLAQNVDGTRRQLLLRFQEDPRAVLLGTSSFWEGIDIPGDALSCVVIVRLPFRVPTDPVQVARTAGTGDAFAEHSLPEAVLRLKQGFGRLIRRRTDRGAVVLLDHRIADRAYGQAFLDALPRAAVELGPVRMVPAAVARWIAAG